jgi:hypothetical protein
VTTLLQRAPSFFLLGLLLAASATRAEPVAPATPAAAAPTPEEPEAPEPPNSPLTSLYPLWENTAHLLKHRDLYLGSSNAEFGILGVAQLGTHPLSFIFRTPNIHGKVRLLSRERLALAAHAEFVVFLPGSSEAFISSNYISRLDTRDILLTVVPVGVTASYEATPWLYLHGTATMMGIFDDGPYRKRVVPGLTLVAEFLAFQRHTFRAHMGEVGFWIHDFNMLGASYCYRRKWFEAQIGYFYRFMREGRQASPLFSLGVYL